MAIRVKELVGSPLWKYVMIMFPLSVLLFWLVPPFMDNSLIVLGIMVFLLLMFFITWSYGLMWLVANKDKFSMEERIRLFVICLFGGALASEYFYWKYAKRDQQA